MLEMVCSQPLKLTKTPAQARSASDPQATFPCWRLLEWVSVSPSVPPLSVFAFPG